MDINGHLSLIDWQKEPRGLYEPIEYTLASGGKRLRPTLALIAGRLFGGNEKDVVPAALALEIFHNFTLLHDDVMDNADVRRGRETVHKKWNVNTAILSGDQMVIEAYKQLSQVPENKLHKTLDLFSQMATEICEGQQYDVDFEHQTNVTIDDYLKMIRLKTSVLLATALQIGAYIAGASEQEQQLLYEYGIHLGLAFQIQDDILDVYGDPVTFGKAIGGDITCNKKTYMLLTALHAADATTKAELKKLLSMDISQPHKKQEKISAVTAIYDRLNVRSVCEECISEHTRLALECLQQLPKNEASEQLRKLAEQLSTRQH